MATRTIGFNIRVLGTDDQVGKIGEIEVGLRKVAEARKQVNDEVKKARAFMATYASDLAREKALYESGAISEAEYLKIKKELQAIAKSARATIAGEAQALGELRNTQTQLNQERRNTIEVINRENRVNRLNKGSYDELNIRLGALRRTYKELGQAQREGAEGQRLLTQIDKLDVRLKRLDAGMGLYQRNVGNYANALTGLTSRMDILTRAAQRQVDQGNANSTTHNRLQAEIARTREEINLLNLRQNGYNATLKQTKESQDEVANSLQRLGAIAGVTFGFQSLKNGVKFLSEFDEQVADTQKTTNLTKKEVQDLGKELSKLDTRTDQDSLLKIGESAGRLNIPTEELAEFVEEVDKFYVALSDELPGTVDEITTEVAKLVSVFKLDEVYGSNAAGITRLGSAINYLSTETKAQAGYILESTQKWAGFAEMAKIGAGNALGIAATLDELGIKVDVGTTAVQKFFTSFAQSPNAFREVAKNAGVTAAEFDRLFKNDPNELFIKILEGAKSSKSGLNALNDTIVQLGITESREIQTITALTGATDMLRRNQGLANDEMERGTSIQNEFDVKNQTLGANIQKVGNYFKNYFVNSGLVNWLRSVTNSVNENIEAWGNVVKVLGTLITVYLAYRAIIITTTAVTATYRSAVLLLAAAKALLTGNTLRAAAAMRLLNITWVASPIGIIVTSMLALGAAVYAFSGNTDKATAAQKKFNNQMEETADKAAAATAETKAQISGLIAVISDETLTIGTRKKAYEDLVAINEVFNGYLVDEKFNVAGLVEIYGQYVKMLDQVAFAKEFAALNNENIKKEVAARQELYNEEVKLGKLRKELRDAEAKLAKDDSFIQQGNLTLKGDVRAQQERVDNAKKNLAAVQKLVGQTNDFRINEIRTLEKEIQVGEKRLADLESRYGKDVAKKRQDYKKLSLELQSDKAALDAILGRTGPDNTAEVVGGETEKEKTKREKAEAKAAEDRKRAQEKAEKEIRENAEYLAKLRNELIEQEINNQEEGISRKIALAELGNKKEIEELQRHKIEKEKLTADEAAINETTDKLIETKNAGHFKRIQDILKESTIKQLEEYKKAMEAKVDITDEECRIIEELDKTLAEKRAKDYEDTYAYKKTVLEKAATTEKNIIDKTIVNEKEKAKAIIAVNLKLAEDKYKVLLDEQSKAKILDERALEELRNLYAEVRRLQTELKEQDSGSGQSFIGDMLNITDEEAQLLIDKASDIMNQIYENFSNARANQIERDLKRETKALERSQKQEQRTLDYKKKMGIISEEQYNKDREDLDAKYDKKKEDLERKAFERRKKLDTANALIAGAMAVMRILADVPKGDFGVSTAILIAAAAITTGLQVANIQAAQYARGGQLAGPSHADGGIKAMLPDGSFVEMEGQEGVINKRSMASNDVLNLSGTPAQIASAINSYKGYGDSFATGAKRVAARGGIMAPAATVNRSVIITQSESGITAEDMQEFATTIVDGYNTKEVVLSEKKVTDAQKEAQVIKNDSTWKSKSK